MHPLVRRGAIASPKRIDDFESPQSRRPEPSLVGREYHEIHCSSLTLVGFLDSRRKLLPVSLILGRRRSRCAESYEERIGHPSGPWRGNAFVDGVARGEVLTRVDVS